MRVRYSFSSRRTRTIDQHNQHRSEFPALVRELVNKCEIILEVLDARFLEETRNAYLEGEIQKEGKKIIYVLNKADLVDKSKLKKQALALGLYPFVPVSCKSRKGSSELRERIKIESKTLKTNFPQIHIGVIGYPNTGKSSIINLLAGKAYAKTASEAGFTKGIQKIKISDDVMIIDTPGVIPQKEYSMQDSGKMVAHTKVSARGYDRAKDPEFIVHELMQQYPGILEKFYHIEANGDSELLIDELGKKKNFLLSGKRIDTDRAARIILKDWQEGKIKV